LILINFTPCQPQGVFYFARHQRLSLRETFKKTVIASPTLKRSEEEGEAIPLMPVAAGRCCGVCNDGLNKNTTSTRLS